MNRINALTGEFERIPETEEVHFSEEAAPEEREHEDEIPVAAGGQPNPLAALLGQFSQPSANSGGHSKSPLAGLFSGLGGLGGPGGIGGGIGGILERLRLDKLEAEDLMLMLILFFLYRESGDPEFLVIMAAMFLFD